MWDSLGWGIFLLREYSIYVEKQEENVGRII